MSQTTTIYRGGSQWHEGEQHADFRIHDGYWRHRHNADGTLTAQDEPLGATDGITGLQWDNLGHGDGPLGDWSAS